MAFLKDSSEKEPLSSEPNYFKHHHVNRGHFRHWLLRDIKDWVQWRKGVTCYKEKDDKILAKVTPNDYR